MFWITTEIMQHHHSSTRWKHIWQVHRHQELKIILLLWTYGPGSPIGPELLGGRKRWPAAMVRAQEEEEGCRA
jgi:hypothetical protein